MYHRIIDAYLLSDREAETSIKYFALQLFTVASVALYIVRHHNIVSRLLAIISAFFTNQIQEKRIVFPPNPEAEIDVDTFPFKSKRFMPVFSDLRYLCHNEPVQQLIAHNHEFISQFAKTCQIFMCINPNKRAASSHVEYETDAWNSVFNVTLSLSRVIKVYGEAYSKATVGELVAAINTVMHHILMCITVVDERRDMTRFPPVEFHEVLYGESTYKIINFDVMDGSISFHHSLQWLLAELFKHVDVLDESQLKTVGLQSLRDVCLGKASEEAMLTIIDYPLRGLSYPSLLSKSFLTNISSTRHDCADPNWALGSEWLCHPRSTSTLQGFHATRAVLRSRSLHPPDRPRCTGSKHGHNQHARPLPAAWVLLRRYPPSILRHISPLRNG